MSEEILLKEGHVIDLIVGHEVYASIPEKYVYVNRPDSNAMTVTDVVIGSKRMGYDTSYISGRYLVVKTAFGGGGTAHGPHDVYPDGHRVWCRRIGRNGEVTKEEVSFYQSGCFTAMIRNIIPVGFAITDMVVREIVPFDLS